MDILDEIKEDLERERYAKFWKDFGGYVMVFIVGLILATGGWVWWKQRQETINQQMGDKFTQALSLLSSGSPDNNQKAITALDAIIASGQAPYAGFAQLDKANALAKEGKFAEAVAVYDKIAADSKTDPAFRSLAGLLAVHALLNDAQADEKNIETRMAKLSATGSPFYYSAQELQALRLLKKGDAKGAQEILQKLASNPLTPGSIRSRAEEIMAGIPVTGVPAPKAEKKETGTNTPSNPAAVQ